MRVLLIFPPTTIYGKDPTQPAIVPPLGLAYLASYLRKMGYDDVVILDARSIIGDRVIRDKNSVLYGMTNNEIGDYVREYQPDIVGVSVMYTAYSGNAHDVAKTIKKIIDVPVVFGGASASTFPQLVLNDINVDVVVHSEGEETFYNIVKCLDEGKKITSVPNISFRSSGVIMRNPPSEFIQNLDEIPFPARDLLDMKLYLNDKVQGYQMRAPSTTMITSRGCPQDCSYCTIKTVWGSKNWRARSPKNVVDEMENLKKEYGIKEIHVLDDAMGTRKKRMIEICDEIIRRKLDIRWTTPNGIAHWYIDENVLNKMKEAGCYRVTFGIESGNIPTRKALGKPFKLEQATKMINYANKIGMWTVCTFIIGFPNEDKSAINDTIDYACSCGTDMALFYLLAPHPGTAVYEEFKSNGLLNYDHYFDPALRPDNLDFESIGLALSGHGENTNYFTKKELSLILDGAYKRFFKERVLRIILNPITILRKTRSIEDIKYTIKIIILTTVPILSSVLSKGFKVQKIQSRSQEEELLVDQLKSIEKTKNDVKSLN